MTNVVRLPDFFGRELRTVVEDSRVTEAVERAIAIHPFAEDVFEAAKWRLAHDLEAGELLPDTLPERRVIFLPPNRLAQSPGLLVRHYLEQGQVVVDWIKFLPYDDATAVTPAAYQV